MNTSLTRYPEGSVKELWALSYPMMLAFLSGYLMNFVDRLFLANYSMESMNAAAVSGMVVIIFMYGASTISSISEVFVGQFNGANKRHLASAPAWQMLWFSAALIIPFWLLAQFGGPYLLPDYHYQDQALPYFQWMLYFGAATPAIAALSGFFVGIGKTRVILVVTVIGNLINITLDPVLIFGVERLIDPMGAKGAAIATGVAQATSFLLLLGLMVSRQYRAVYNTLGAKLDLPLLLRCLKVGVPNAVGHIFEWSAWAISLRLMATVGEYYLTVATIGQTLYMLAVFGIEGIQKAITTLVANRLGEGNKNGIQSTFHAALKLLMLLAIPYGCFLLVYPDPVISEFLSTETPESDVILLTRLLRITASGVFCYFITDGITWICVGVLTAAEDTFFIMWVNALTAWTLALFPIFIFLATLRWSPAWYFFFLSGYGACNALIFYWRMKHLPILQTHLTQ